jgi:hypothetical protein
LAGSPDAIVIGEQKAEENGFSLKGILKFLWKTDY